MNANKYLSVFSLVAILGANKVNAQLDSVPVNNDKTISIQSAALNEQRSIWMHLPENYNATGKTYPVLYVLDGEGHFKYISQLVDYLAGYDRNRIPEMIVVGIVNIDRTRDFTPVHSLLFDGKKDSVRMGTTGGGAKFLAFIKDEVIPYIDAHFRTQPYRILAAHSLGGLFATYAMEKIPGLFAANILMSPAIYGGNATVLGDFKPFLENHPDLRGKLFISLADENRQTVDSMIHLLKTFGQKKMESAFQQYKDENHFSVTYKSMFDGLKFIYRNWFVDNYSAKKWTWKEIETHFNMLSAEFGYKILPAEDFSNNAGYKQLNAGNVDAAIEIFKHNILIYPGSWNAYDSMGEAYAVKGEITLAIENYEKSIFLNPANEDGKKALQKLKKPTH
jgi:predicted alpha/beta superfamily hydrolase